MTRPLVEQFQFGLDAPICLTWELTYACNLSCVHCLSSSGRRDPRELTTAECQAVIDELERMQVFYVNIGGGEPTVRPDFWELVDYATAHQVGVKFSTNGVKITPDGPASWPPPTTSTCRSRWTARPPRSTTRCAGPVVRHGAAGDGESGRRRVPRLQDLRGDDPAERRPARRVQGDRRPVRRAAADHPAAAVGAGRGRVGRAAPHRGSSGSSTTGWSPTASRC